MVVRRHRTFLSLSVALNQLGEQVVNNVNRAKVETAKAVARSVIEATPVDTGRARSNWLPKIGSPPSHTRMPHAPGEHLGRGETANQQAAVARADAVFTAAKPGQPLYLKNNLKYIARLNEGYSKQSPAGFVGIAVIEALSSLRTVKILK